MSNKLSILVVAHNEAHQLRDCLDKLKFGDEIVVVLDKCTDNSKEIVLEYTDKILEGSWELEGHRRNAGIEFCTGDWILEVDADERVQPQLTVEIREVINSTTADYHLVPIENYVGKTLVRHGWGGSFGTASDLALFKKFAKRWGTQRVHPSLTLKGSKGHRLTHGIDHYVDDNLADMIHRLNRYSTLRALDMFDAGQTAKLLPNVRRLFSRFIKCYWSRNGYKEGFYGFTIALCAGLFPLLSVLKLRELHLKK
jgi:glycosyltransferase involved in cell wall biosynthesis